MKTRLRKKFAKKKVEKWLGERPTASGNKLVVYGDYETAPEGDNPVPPSLAEALGRFNFYGYTCTHHDLLPPVAGKLVTPEDFRKAREDRDNSHRARQEHLLQTRIANQKQKFGGG